MHQGESCQTQAGLYYTATSGEKQQLHSGAILAATL